MNPNSREIVKLSKTKSSLIGGVILCLILTLSRSEIGQTIRYHMETITAFSLRHILDQEPELSKKIKIFIYDDPSVAQLKKFDLSLDEWSDVLRAIAEREPQSIIIDKLFDNPIGIEAKDKFIKLMTDFPGLIHIANFSTPIKITGRKEIAIRPQWQHADIPNSLKHHRHYPYGAQEDIEPKMSSGHIRYEGRGLVRPYSYIANNAAIPHISFSVYAEQHVRLNNSGIYVQNEIMPIKRDGTIRVNQIHRKKLLKKTFNFVELYNRSQSGRQITPVNKGDHVIILPAMYTGSTDWLTTPLGLTQGGFIIVSMVNSHLTKSWLRYIEFQTVFMIIAGIIGIVIAYLFWGFKYIALITAGFTIVVTAGNLCFVFLGLECPWFYTATSFLSCSLIVTLERARLSGLEQVRLENEMRTSELVQRTFLSHSQSANNHIQIEHFFKSATECSGDWWGHFAIDERTYCVIIADAVGHGTPAALITAMAYSSYKTFAELNDHKLFEKLTPAMILKHFNSVLFNAVHSSYFMTCICIFIDTKTGEVRLANAGHARPIHLIRNKPGREGVRSIASRGNPLGLNAGESYTEKKFIISPGDRMILFTDGLYECSDQNGKIWGKRNLERLLRDVKEQELSAIKNTIVEQALNHVGTKPVDDDITLVTLEWLG